MNTESINKHITQEEISKIVTNSKAALQDGMSFTMVPMYFLHYMPLGGFMYISLLYKFEWEKYCNSLKE